MTSNKNKGFLSKTRGIKKSNDEISFLKIIEKQQNNRKVKTWRTVNGEGDKTADNRKLKKLSTVRHLIENGDKSYKARIFYIKKYNLGQKVIIKIALVELKVSNKKSVNLYKI